MDYENDQGGVGERGGKMTKTLLWRELVAMDGRPYAEAYYLDFGSWGVYETKSGHSCKCHPGGTSIISARDELEAIRQAKQQLADAIEFLDMP